LVILASTFVIWPLARSAADETPVPPFTQLFDLGRRWPSPLPAEAAARRSGWTALPEDVVEHRFTGDVAMANDQLTVVFRRESGGGEVYARRVSLPRAVAQLAPRDASGRPARLRGARILENTQSSTALGVQYDLGPGARAEAEWRLTTGQPTVEFRPRSGIAWLAVVAWPRHVVVPNFFGSDQVFTPPSPWPARLPVENMLLQLGTPETMVMNVWPPGGNQVRPIAEPGADRRNWVGCQIQCLPGKPLWTAVLQGSPLWHAAPADRPPAADWRPPIPAKWRADVAGPSGWAHSWMLGTTEAEARAGIAGSRGQAPPTGEAGGLLVYPIDRSRATPLAAILPIDVLRNTLGIGPCQYILEREGWSAEGSPTAEAVTEWVEQQFARHRDRRLADEIAQRLDLLAAHMKQVQVRLAEYAALVRKLRAGVDGRQAGPLDEWRLLDETLAALERTLAEPGALPVTAGKAGQLCRELAALAGRPDGPAESRRLGAELRALGAGQNRALADCRLLLRRMGALAEHAARSPDGAWIEPARKQIDQTFEK
jgi:hypothetical protein